MFDNMKKYKTIEYAVYTKEGDFIDVLDLTKKQAKEFLKENPEYTLEEIDELEEDE
jgi:hypothetical protein